MEEFKKDRVPGEPRHFVDCYLDELDKVGKENINEYLMFIILFEEEMTMLILKLKEAQHYMAKSSKRLDKC